MNSNFSFASSVDLMVDIGLIIEIGTYLFSALSPTPSKTQYTCIFVIIQVSTKKFKVSECVYVYQFHKNLYLCGNDIYTGLYTVCYMS